MTYINRLILITTIMNIFFLCSCNSNTRNNTINHNLNKQYLLAKKKLSQNNHKDAIKKLENLNQQYPYNPYSNQIYFDLIYAYYKSMDFPLTFKTIDNFINSHPKHPNIDYPLYIQGLSYMELDNNQIFNKLLKFNHIQKNPLYACKAFHSFSQLINQHPNSQYIPDAYKRLIYLKNRIAEHELSIIQYYNKKGAHIAVINRSEEMLRYFSDTKATYDALQCMCTAYHKLNLLDQSNKVMKIITHNKR